VFAAALISAHQNAGEILGVAVRYTSTAASFAVTSLPSLPKLVQIAESLDADRGLTGLAYPRHTKLVD